MIAFKSIYLSTILVYSFLSIYPTSPLAPFLLSFLLTSFHPSLPSPPVFTPLCPLPLPVSPVYEGKFTALPGAVSWRWPPLLKPQQGFTLHMAQTQQSGTEPLPPPHISRDSTLAPLVMC